VRTAPSGGTSLKRIRPSVRAFRQGFRAPCFRPAAGIFTATLFIISFQYPPEELPLCNPLAVNRGSFQVTTLRPFPTGLCVERITLAGASSVDPLESLRIVGQNQFIASSSPRTGAVELLHQLRSQRASGFHRFRRDCDRETTRYCQLGAHESISFPLGPICNSRRKLANFSQSSPGILLTRSLAMDDFVVAHGRTKCFVELVQHPEVIECDVLAKNRSC